MTTAHTRADEIHPTTNQPSVHVVGASAAGICNAEALRSRGFDGTITLLGDEQHLPYDRPPLSTQVLSGAWEPDRSRLRSAEVLAEQRIDLILGERATHLDPATRTVRTASGASHTADDIVVATGAGPRTPPWHRDLDGVFVLRSLDDSIRLRASLREGTQVVVIGGGVLGTEITATARSMGAAVTIIGPQSAPLAAQLGERVGDLIGSLHVEHGVIVRSSVGVAGLAGEDGRVTGVELDTGETLPFDVVVDVVVVAVGAVPATDWLAGSGLAIDNGVVCDSRCRAADHVYAAGDVARWHHAGLGRLIRLENRTNATTQGSAVAAAIVGIDTPYCPIPYFWTDQFDLNSRSTDSPTAVPNSSCWKATSTHGDPEQLALVRDSDDPAVITAAVEDLLRYLNITHNGRARVALEDLEIGETTVRAGDGLIMATDIGNRDPEVFDDPDRLDITRDAPTMSRSDSGWPNASDNRWPDSNSRLSIPRSTDGSRPWPLTARSPTCRSRATPQSTACTSCLSAGRGPPFPHTRSQPQKEDEP